MTRDSLRRKIDTGIAASRFGIIVLSGPFFAKGWPQYCRRNQRGCAGRPRRVGIYQPGPSAAQGEIGRPFATDRYRNLPAS
ncbi:MAG: hypothetical protein ACJ768_18705, partial [Gaiellaceae bacterium]